MGGGHGGPALGPILASLGAGNCHELHRLLLPGVGMTKEDARVLGHVLQSGACPTLEDLDLEFNEDLGGEGLAYVMGALERGACPHLKNLKLPGVEMKSSGAAALARALTSGSLSHIQSLDVRSNGIRDEGMTEILKALATACHDVRKIDLACLGKLSQSLEAFHAALGHNAWP